GVAREVGAPHQLPLPRAGDGAIGDLAVPQPEALEPRLVVLEPALRVDDLEVRPADYDRLLAQHLELSLELAGDGGGAPAELDDRDVIAGDVEHVLPRARAATFVE